MDAYLWILDDTKGRAPAEKIAAAVAAFVKRFHAAPALVLTSIAERASVVGIVVEAREDIRPGLFWVGPIVGLEG